MHLIFATELAPIVWQRQTSSLQVLGKDSEAPGLSSAKSAPLQPLLRTASVRGTKAISFFNPLKAKLLAV